MLHKIYCKHLWGVKVDSFHTSVLIAKYFKELGWPFFFLSFSIPLSCRNPDIILKDENILFFSEISNKIYNYNSKKIQNGLWGSKSKMVYWGQNPKYLKVNRMHLKRKVLFFFFNLSFQRKKIEFNGREDGVKCGVGRMTGRVLDMNWRGGRKKGFRQ